MPGENPTINGRLYDWGSVEIQLPSGIAVGATEISYNDEMGREARYGKGRTPRGFGTKNYKAGGSMTLDKDEAQRLREGLGGKVYGDTPFDIVVSYAPEGKPVITDTLPQVLITKSDTSAKQDEDNTGVEKFDFTIFSPIKWNGQAAV
ncbi:MAG: hypothetical protein HQL72_09090 [Magnetococcales bacterium]|nr:hypothetical protein [Magnetococcales bacterium]